MKRRLLFGLIICAVAAAVVAVTLNWPKTTPAPRPPAPLNKPALSGAHASRPLTEPKVRATDGLILVRLYLSALKADNLAAAYAYLSPDLQKTLTYGSFVAGFHGTRLTSYDLSLLRVLGAGNYSLIVGVPYTLTGPQGTAPYVATLRCVNISPGTGRPDWRVESVSYQAQTAS